ncbi:MAG TPA: cellulose binding domain-containing protein [Rugosimonospora sp.]|nr:cellulose binding domain-containing protein [Rugosimonospora sp.]
MSLGRTRVDRPRYSTLALGALTLAAGALSVVAASPASAATAVPVTVNATAGFATIAPNAIGLNTAVYDGNMNNAAQPGLLKAAGFTALRYPGGSYSDIYNWQTNVADGGYDAPNTSFSDFMGTAQAAGASPIITVNYGTGTPDLAAAWVQNANVTNHYGIKWWEVGNETAGNGTYGANWEADSHCTDASGAAIPKGTHLDQTYNCGPSVYAANVLKFITAMKAVDPTVHVCVQLTTPGFWPDGVTNAQSPQPWNQTVLSALGAKTDCVIVHYYPAGFPPNPDLVAMLNYPTQIPGIVSGVKAAVAQYAGVNPATVPILVTETNSNVAQDVQPNALFAADSYLTWLENGVSNVDWWNQHNGPGTPAVINGAQDYGDGGLFSSGTNGSGVTEPPLDTPFAPYYGIQMLSKLGAAGDTMVSAASGNTLVKVHAVRRAGGGLNVLIVNEDPANSYTTNLTYNGFTPSGSPTVYTFANNAHAITTTTQNSTASVTVGPYSLTVLQIPGSGGTVATVPGPPGQPAASNLSSSTSGNTSGTATLTWAASTPGSNPIATYKVYQLDGTASTLVSTQTGTTLNLSGLTIGTSYRYDVIAVDTQGNTSLPSSPGTFTIPPPANAACAVHYAVSNSWPGGFGASITVTNRAATAINGWTLTFTWPAAGEAVQSGWNGTWTQTGQNVTVTNANWNGTITAGGGTLSLGFNGNDTGQFPAPAAFFINGNVCSNI